MTDQAQPFPSPLEALLGDRAKDTIYPCIRDLVGHGIDRARFAAGEVVPHRQELTQYLAAWARNTGLTEEETRDWLMDYCVARYAAPGVKTPAAVRHSTKSNVRYIYRSAVPFLCECANNPFKAHCGEECPILADMQEKVRVRASTPFVPRSARPAAPLPEPTPRVKVLHREQFEAGLRLALEEEQKGTKFKRILEILQERGLKTRTGRAWSRPTLDKELRFVKYARVPSVVLQPGGKSGGLPERPAAEPVTPPKDGPATPLDNPNP